LHDVPEWIIVGRVKRAHGTAGELLVESLTDFDERFGDGVELHLARKGEEEKQLVRIASSRPVHEGIIVRLEGVSDREQAKAYTAAELFIPLDQVGPAGDDSFYTFELNQCRVYQGDELVGSVEALVESRANPYLEVSGEDGKTVLVPFVKDVIHSIDVEAGRIELSEGFLR
jgi:16S rRNA processing protein RimM